MGSTLRAMALIVALVLPPLSAFAAPPARDKATWSLIDTSRKVVKPGVGELYRPPADTNPGISKKVQVQTVMVDGRPVFQTVDAQDKHVLAVFPPDLLLGYAVDPSGLVVILRLEKTGYGTDHFVYGFAKATGEIVVEPQYDSAGPFGPNGLAPVHKDNKAGFIDTQGTVQIPLQFLDAKTFGDNGLAPVKTSAGWGYIDAHGAFVIPPHYSDAKPFNDKDLAPAADRLWGYIDHTGAFVISPRFDDAWTFWPDGTALVKFAGKDKTFIDQAFGPWTLKAAVTPEPEHPIFGPDLWAYVEIIGQSEDQAITWRLTTHGDGLGVETKVNPPGTGFTQTTMFDFPAKDSGFIDILDTQLAALFAQTPSTAGKYSKDLAAHRADLLQAIAAMRRASTDLWIKQSRPCLPPDCIY